jgi:hypothetical protein
MQNLCICVNSYQFALVDYAHRNSFWFQLLIHILIHYEQPAIGLLLFHLTGQSYRLEKLNLPGVPVDLDLPLSSTNTTQFCLIRENS